MLVFDIIDKSRPHFIILNIHLMHCDIYLPCHDILYIQGDMFDIFMFIILFWDTASTGLHTLMLKKYISSLIVSVWNALF